MVIKNTLVFETNKLWISANKKIFFLKEAEEKKTQAIKNKIKYSLAEKKTNITQLMASNNQKKITSGCHFCE